MGQSKEEKAYHKQMTANAAENSKLQREMFELTKKGTPEEQLFRMERDEFNSWLKKKDYGSNAPGILNFDLFTPAMQAKQRERLGDITGIGAAAMSGTGDQSIAVAQSRDRMANESALANANAYENAVKGQDAYYKGSNFQYANLGANTNLSLLGNATSSAQFFYDQQRRTLPKSFLSTFGPQLIGGALQAGSALLGNPSLFRA